MTDGQMQRFGIGRGRLVAEQQPIKSLRRISIGPIILSRAENQQMTGDQFGDLVEQTEVQGG